MAIVGADIKDTIDITVSEDSPEVIFFLKQVKLSLVHDAQVGKHATACSNLVQC
jgi:hypothetical protein